MKINPISGGMQRLGGDRFGAVGNRWRASFSGFSSLILPHSWIGQETHRKHHDDNRYYDANSRDQATTRQFPGGL
jgi:hypothetical protein